MGAAIDWGLAATVGARFAPTGPDLAADVAHESVRSLRECATNAVEHVERTTLLRAGVPATEGTAVVDRRTWIERNIAGFRTLLAPALSRIETRSPGVVTAVGSRITGVQIGGVLAFLSGKVLGQYDAFGPTPGRLLLVAPNIVATERALGVDPADFRLWVCLHEETHRVQFEAVPWLGPFLLSRIHTYLELTDVDAAEVLRRLRDSSSAAVRATRAGDRPSLLDIAQSPAQRVVLDELTGVMSLLEGHAEWVMDAVGPDIVPSIATIRARFDQKRSSASGLDAIVRRLLGLDAKLAQYTEGAQFVRHVVDAVGVSGLNHVWAGPDALPTRAEITDPDAWVGRVVSRTAS